MSNEITLTLSEEDAQLLTDVIDIWVAGMADAKDSTTEDPNITSVEELLELMSGYDDDAARFNLIRKQLNPKKPEPLTQQQKIDSRKRWDAKYEEGQKRNG